MIKGQLIFMESFVEDLLNLHMMGQGVFSLDSAFFDPYEALLFIQEIFRLNASMKGVKVIIQCVDSLPLPTTQPWGDILNPADV